MQELKRWFTRLPRSARIQIQTPFLYSWVQWNRNTLPDDTLDLEGLHCPLIGKIFKCISTEICTAPLPEEIELESMAYDGLENLTGYICHKLSARVPGIQVNPDEDNTYTWVNHLSEGGLAKPTMEMMEHMTNWI